MFFGGFVHAERAFVQGVHALHAIGDALATLRVSASFPFHHSANAQISFTNMVMMLDQGSYVYVYQARMLCQQKDVYAHVPMGFKFSDIIGYF